MYNAYLPQISELYLPVDKESEHELDFDPNYNIRWFNITKWVSDKNENSLEKLINVYEVLSDENCNIALIFHRKRTFTQVYLAVSNNKNADNNIDANSFKSRLSGALKGNFPGAEWITGGGSLPFMDKNRKYPVASASNISTEKSEKFISQTIEKLLDGIIPESPEQEYTLILLATPITDIEQKKTRLMDLYSGLAPYAQWQTNFTYTELNSQSSSAQIGVNVGASAGVQNGTNQADTVNKSTTDSQNIGETNTEGSSVANTSGTSETNSKSSGTSQSITDTTSQNNSLAEGTNNSVTESKGSSNSVGVNGSISTSVNGGVNILGITGNKGFGGSIGVSGNHGWNEGTANTTGTSVTNTVSSGTSHSVLEVMTEQVTQALSKSAAQTVSNSTTKAITNTLGRAITQSVAKTTGAYKGLNLGANFGVNFARSSNVTATIGKNEGLTQTFTNYNIRHALELLEEQMKRYEQSSALGMWDFAAYVMGEDSDIVNNVAHSYIALTQGEQSFMSKSAINVWRGDLGDEKSGAAKEICGYLRELRHPIFCPNPVRIMKISTLMYIPPRSLPPQAFLERSLHIHSIFPANP